VQLSRGVICHVDAPWFGTIRKSREMRSQ
jgi:hypothetical protein